MVGRPEVAGVHGVAVVAVLGDGGRVIVAHLVDDHVVTRTVLGNRRLVVTATLMHRFGVGLSVFSVAHEGSVFSAGPLGF